MTISYWQQNLSQAPQLSNSKSFDVCIIGAGIAGLSTAYWLEKNNPNLKIAIIDQFFLGAGASGRNAGFITCGSAEHFQKLITAFGINKATEIWQFSEKNRELLIQEILNDDFDSVDFKQTGSCTVAATADDWQRYQNLSLTMHTVGIDTELVDEKYLEHHYGVNGFSGAIQYKHDGVIHPIKLLEKIKSKLKSTTFIFGEKIINIESNSVCKITTTQIQIQCQKIFSCLNGFTSELLLEYKNLIKPQRGQIILTEPLPLFVKGPCYLTKHLCYFRQLHTGELLVGGFRNFDIENENTATDQITEKIQNALTDFTQNYFKNTKNIRIKNRWSGIMGFTPDGQLILGEHPTHKNIFLMGGCSGHGMGLSFHAAKVLVESSENIKAGTHDVPAHFKIDRFKI